MDTQARRLGHRVDQVRERSPAAEREVVALGEAGLGHPGRVQPCKARSQRGGGQPGGVHHRTGLQSGAVFSYQFNSTLRTLGKRQRRIQCQDTTGILQITLQRQHQAMAVHDARFGRMQRGHAFECGFQRARCVALQPLQLHAIALRMGLYGPQGRQLIGGSSHDQLAAALVRHIALRTVAVQLFTALHTQPGFERALGVVDTGMDDLAVARAGACANCIGRFEHQNLAPLQGQGTRHGQAHHASPHHHAIDLVHHG